MKIKVAVLAIVLALVGALAYSRFIAGHTPVGQPTLANLDPASFEQQFRAAASGGSGRVRRGSVITTRSSLRPASAGASCDLIVSTSGSSGMLSSTEGRR